MRDITQKDIEFLAKLQEEMNTQSHDCQAAPRFWVVAQEEKMVASIDNCDGGILINNEGTEIGETLEQVKKYFKDNLEQDEYESLNLSYFDSDEYIDFEDISSFLNNVYPNAGYQVWYYKNVHVIKDSTFFLTKRECKEHIEANHYHYNKTVHSYAMTAWRSPQVETLYEILENVDFSTLLQGVKQ